MIRGKIFCSKSDLTLLFTLTGGQCFRWKTTGENEWTGVFAHKVWTLLQKEDHIEYSVTWDRNTTKSFGDSVPKRTVAPRKNKTNQQLKLRAADVSQPEKQANNSDDEHEEERVLKNYFRLDSVNLQELYSEWSEKDPAFKVVAVKFQGVRILDQDPTENLFSFICSSNNHISRISSMVEKLCTMYGEKIVEVGGIAYHDFPSVSALADPSVESALRQAGFGYRAKFIHHSAKKIQEMGGTEWLNHLQSLPYDDAKAQLIKLPGIGAKVADCICLMSLGHLEAIPVDTHIYQVAKRYLPHLKNSKSVTDKVYNEIGEYFRNIYGKYAGWAHTILFCDDLKMFQAVKQPVREGESTPAKSQTKRRKLTK